MIRKTLRLFINTFTADGKYSLLNRDKLMQPIHMQLSQKQKNFLITVKAIEREKVSLSD